MFGGAKPTFGAAAPNTGFGFNNTATASPFGQSAFGKPATTAFGAAPTFGTPQATPSMFGSATGQPQSSGLFGGASTSTGFGTAPTTQPTFGAFQQPQQNTSIFGAAQPTANTNTLFGQTQTSAFGAGVKPTGLSTFGQTATQPTSSLFGQPAAVSTSSTNFGTFGQTAATTTNVFGSTQTSAFGQPAAATATTVNAGTSIAKYQPTVGTDTLIKGGQPNNINTKQHCITAMKEYEGKSLEELRMEDYLANRKGPQAGSTGFFGTAAQPTSTAGGGLFGSTTQQTTGLFGQPAAGTTENKGLFNSSAFGQPATSAFGAATQPQNNFLAKPFGSTATSAFGATTTDASNPFGNKPAFGQTPQATMFGQPPASTAPTFNSGFSGFGTPANTQQTSLFGPTANDANKPTFGLGSAANAVFSSFGSAQTSTAGPFGAKPNTGFGTTTSAFGATSTANNAGFPNFSLSNTTGTGLFNNNMNKPVATGFGNFGAQTAAPSLNFNAGAPSNSLFGNTAPKTAGFFGSNLGTNTNNPSTGLFGQNTSAFGANNTLGSNFGQTTLGGGMNNMSGLGSTPQQQQQIPIHQQILSKVTSPYGDNPIFKDLKRSDEVDAMRATNPSAQKAILESSSNQFKISAKSSPSVKVKPIGSTMTKKSLFEGLEEYDASVESFTLKPNAKRLVLKPNNSELPMNNVHVDKPNASMVDSVPAAVERNNESFTVSSPKDQNKERKTTGIENAPPASTAKTTAPLPRDSDGGRRESWLHPNNLEKVRQHNLNAGSADVSPLNSTLSELVPRKALDTYRPLASGRPSVSTMTESPFEDQTSGSRSAIFGQDDSLFSNRSYGVDERSILIEQPQAEYEEHPTGITLKRVGYYTIPTLDELKSYLAEDGSCVVPNFTIGREGYGNVYFSREIDVAGLNLDEIVHFRNKEVIIYPDDENKPPIGSGLNREAQVTLDQVWPIDKTKHEPIKDTERLAKMDWEGKLRRVCDKNDTRFIEYRTETGSWVFRVKHFSKYGLNESDEEEELPTDAKKAKLAAAAAANAGKKITPAEKITFDSLKQAQKISEEAARSIDPKTLTAGNFAVEDAADFMLMDRTNYLQSSHNDSNMFEHYPAQKISAAQITSPTTTLAKDAGTDSHKLQLMKASFFLDDEIDEKPDNCKFNRHNNKNNALLGRRKHEIRGTTQVSPWKDTDGAQSDVSSQFEYGSITQAPSSGASMLSIIRETQTEASSPMMEYETTTMQLQQQQPTQIINLPPLIIKPKVAPVKSLAVQVPYNRSISFALQGKWAADLGLYNSRRFKLSFGPQNTFIVPTTYNNSKAPLRNTKLAEAVPHIFRLRENNDYSATLLQHVQMLGAQHYDNFNESIINHLHIQLHYALQEAVEDTECPWIHANEGPELIVKHMDEAIKLINEGPLEQYAVSVWSLMLALWGDHDMLEDHEPSSHYYVMTRRNFISDWLENTLTDQDVLNKQVTKNSYLSHLLELVMCHKVTEACELAFMHDDANLAMLLAELSSGPVVRQLMEDQLAAWHKNKADTFIATERLKLCMLVAGVALMSSAHGPLNVLDGLDWIKSLALQLWYMCAPTSSITDALFAYDKTFKADEFYSLPPSPAYFERDTNSKEIKSIYDLRYHLLQLYSKRSHPLESLLNPATHTADPMDYRLSWLLLQTLEALGYRHCSELSESQLHVGFASQLENYDHWEWAIFVLLHIKDRNQREISVQNLLYRYVSVSADVALTNKEKFVINNLGVPEKWIDYAKAVKAGAEGNRNLQAKYLLRAKQWSLAHEIIFEYLAPDAVINDNLEYLHKLLSQFEHVELNKSIKVPNWANQGQIFLDFIDIKEKFKGLKTLNNEADIETHWENLKPQLADLCSRINLLPCPTSKHRLCQSEIAQNLACLVRGVLLVCPVLNPCLIIKIALERLPLPQEFAQQELRALLDTLVLDLSKIRTTEMESSSNNNNLMITDITVK